MPVAHQNLDHLVMAGLAIALIAGWLAWRCRGFFTRLVLAVVALAFLGPSVILGVGRNPWLVDARYRTYMQFYWSLGKGMSREEVMAMLEKAYPPTGPRIRPRIIEDSGTRLGFHMNPENQPQPDHEAIYLKLEAGKVMGKSYERN
jgi:hypothetical protein